MVHIKKCPCEYGRGKPTTEFYKIVDGKRKPQIYCYGWIDKMTDDPLQCCLDCDDFVDGEQCEKDFEKHRADREALAECYKPKLKADLCIIDEFAFDPEADRSKEDGQNTIKD